MAILARGALVLSSLIYIPLTINYLGVERFGIFVALTSLTSMLVFADLGLGNGLLNVVSDSNGRQDPESASRAVASAFFMLIGVAVIMGIAVLITFPLLDWQGLFRLTDPAAKADVGATAAVVIATFLIALPLGVVERVRMAFQEGYVNSIAAMTGTIGAFIALLVAIQFGASLPFLVMAISVPPVLAIAVNGFRLFRSDRPWLRPRLARADARVALSLARIGFLFLVLQLAVAVAFQSDVLVAATVLGPEAATTYAVTIRVFMLVPSLIGLYLVTLWPAYTEALARNDVTWVRRTLRRSIGIAAVSSAIASVTLLVGGGLIIGTLTGGTVEPPTALLIGAAIWAVVSAGFNAVGILLNAASIVRFQVVIASIMALASISASVLFAFAFGVSGIIWGTLLSYVVCAAVPITVFLPRVMRRLDASAASEAPA
jgi:O-antigen/teichoic acid export membrane protein